MGETGNQSDINTILWKVLESHLSDETSLLNARALSLLARDQRVQLAPRSGLAACDPATRQHATLQTPRAHDRSLSQNPYYLLGVPRDRPRTGARTPRGVDSHRDFFDFRLP